MSIRSVKGYYVEIGDPVITVAGTPPKEADYGYVQDRQADSVQILFQRSQCTEWLSSDEVAHLEFQEPGMDVQGLFAQRWPEELCS